MEIAAIPLMTPPAMAPACELCPPTGIDVLVLFEDPVFEDLVVEAGTVTDETVAPSTVPGPSSGESMRVRRGREIVTGGPGIQGRKFSPPVAYDLLKSQ